MDEHRNPYESIEMLEALGLPVSTEQIIEAHEAETEYIRNDLVPEIKRPLNKSTLALTKTNSSRIRPYYNFDGAKPMPFVGTSKRSFIKRKSMLTTPEKTSSLAKKCLLKYRHQCSSILRSTLQTRCLSFVSWQNK